MKIKEGFIIREIEGDGVVFAVGKASEQFNGICKLNKTCTDIWHGIENGLSEKEIAKNLTEKYKVDIEKAENDVKNIINRLKTEGFIE